MAAFASAFTMAAMGVSTTQMWWVTTLIAVGLIFIAIARGQFRTKRPKVLLPMLGER
jgi:predicted cobalt transporter CbtA